MQRAEQDWAPWQRRTRPSLRVSARNLVHYWALRQHDLQDLQQTLSAYGLSSLGRSEPHVAATLAAVHALVKVLRGQQRPGTRRADRGRRDHNHPGPCRRPARTRATRQTHPDHGDLAL